MSRKVVFPVHLDIDVLAKIEARAKHGHIAEWIRQAVAERLERLEREEQAGESAGPEDERKGKPS